MLMNEIIPSGEISPEEFCSKLSDNGEALAFTPFMAKVKKVVAGKSPKVAYKDKVLYVPSVDTDTAKTLTAWFILQPMHTSPPTA